MWNQIRVTANLWYFNTYPYIYMYQFFLLQVFVANAPGWIDSVPCLFTVIRVLDKVDNLYFYHNTCTYISQLATNFILICPDTSTKKYVFMQHLSKVLFLTLFFDCTRFSHDEKAHQNCTSLLTNTCNV